MNKVKYCMGSNKMPFRDATQWNRKLAHPTVRMHQSLTGSYADCPICGRRYITTVGFVCPDR